MSPVRPRSWTGLGFHTESTAGRYADSDDVTEAPDAVQVGDTGQCTAHPFPRLRLGVKQPGPGISVPGPGGPPRAGPRSQALHSLGGFFAAATPTHMHLVCHVHRMNIHARMHTYKRCGHKMGRGEERLVHEQGWLAQTRLVFFGCLCYSESASLGYVFVCACVHVICISIHIHVLYF
jgi:hypothetical protein